MNTLFKSYKKRLYAYGSELQLPADQQADAGKATAGQAGGAPGLSAGLGMAASLGGGIIDSFDKADPLTGRHSIGSGVGKGALNGAAAGAALGPWGAAAGAVIGGALGFINGKKEQKEARAQLHRDVADKTRLENDMSGARLAADPTLFEGYKNSGYFAMGGAMLDPTVLPGEEGPDDPKKKGTPASTLPVKPKVVLPKTPPTGTTPGTPPATPQRMTAQEMNEWNQFQDYVASQKLAGSKDLDKRDKNRGQAMFNEFKKANPNVSINYDVVPRAQYEFARLQKHNEQFSARRNEAKPTNWDDISKYDGWYGSLTSQQKFVPLVQKNQDGTETNLGLINGDGIPTSQMGQGAAAGKVKRKWNIGDAGVLETPDGRYIAPDGTELKAYGGRMMKYAAGGGMITSPLASMFMQGGNAKSLSSDNAEFQGPSHSQGGIQIPELNSEVEGKETTANNYVFSRRLGFAQAHKPIAVAKGKIEKKPATFERVNAMRRLTAKEQQLMQQQEIVKKQLNLS